MFDKEMLDKIEKMRLEGQRSPQFMLAVLKGCPKEIAEESERKKKIVEQAFCSQASTEGKTMSELLSSDNKSKINAEELEMILEIIEEHYSDKEFLAKDIVGHLPQVNGEPILNSRQVPSRMKKLLNWGKIVDIPHTSPKKYTLAK
jgi:hypothetical protein